MKKIIICLIVALGIATITQAQTTAVKLKVTDADNLNLPGASVSLSPGKHFAVTNQRGEAVFSQVKNGRYTLSITYLGYADVKKNITVDEHSNVFTEQLAAGKYVTNEEVIVIGDRLKGQAKALNQQKNSGNITNIVSADQIGRFPDANIGDAIKRIPGITMQNDQGEARNIVIRGMGPEMNSVTFNGERIPSAEGDNRRVQMDLIPSDMVQTVEVNKTLTADMDADAIGSSVNLVTRTAPNGLRISGTLAGGYNPIRKGFNGTAGLVLGNRFANDKLGFILSGSFNRNVFGSDNVEAEWEKNKEGKFYVNDHDVRVYDEMRIRRSVAATFDYKINPFNTIYLTGSYNWRDDKENRFRLRHRYKGKDIEADLLKDAGGNITGYKNGEVIRQTKGGLDNDRNEGRRLEDQRVRSIALNGDHLFGKLKTNWSVQYAKASEQRPNERYMAMSINKIQVTQDISDLKFPLLTDNTALDKYTKLAELTEQFQKQYEKDLNAKLNFELPLSIIKEQKGAIKFGVRLRAKNKVRDNSFFEYEPVTAIANLSTLPLVDRTNKDFYPGSKYIAGQFITPQYVGGLELKNSSKYKQTDVPEEYLAGNYNAKETVTAGYLSFIQNFTDAFSANVGIRVEHTNPKYTGNIVDDNKLIKKTEALGASYLDVLPSINLKYKMAENFVLKAAFARSIARPKYYDLVPYINIISDDNEIYAGNTTLIPVRASNFDIIAEKYFKSIGLVSAGVFHKRLDKFFYNYIDDSYTADKFSKDFPGLNNPIAANDKWDFAQRRNGDGASVTGFEFALQRQFDFLPGMWKGFGIYLNYTYTHSKANADGSLGRTNVKLPGAAPHILNASLSYENKRLSARLSANYTSSYIDDSDDGGYNEKEYKDRYYDQQFFLDANASYAITPKLRIFAEANNLTNQPLRYYQGDKSRTAQVEFYGPKYNMGLKFDLLK